MTTPGEQLRNAGVDQVLANEGRSRYVEHAEAALSVLIRRGEPFSSNDVHRLLLDTPANVPHHPNVVPGLFAQASKSGRIRRVGTDTATAEASHARKVGLWISSAVADSEIVTPEVEERVRLQHTIDVFRDFMRRLEERMGKLETDFSQDPVRDTHTGQAVLYTVRIVREEIDRKVEL